MNRELLAVRNYVTQEQNVGQHIHDDTLLLDVTHSNLQQRHVEIRFNKQSTIADLKTKIYQSTGTPAPHQHLLIYDTADNLLHDLGCANNNNNSQYDHYPLGYFIDQQQRRIHVIDTNPHSISKNGALEDTRLVKKFTLTDEQYDARPNTLRTYKKAQGPHFTFANDLALRHARKLHAQGLPLPAGFGLDPNNTVIALEPATTYNHHSVSHISIGARCQVLGGRRGVVQWVGEVEKIEKGYFVGIQLDEPSGKNNGSLFGTRYFDCPDRCGLFTRGDKVQVGDFPELDDIIDSSDEDEL